MATCEQWAEWAKLNADRIGKNMLTLNGKEMVGCIVLSDSSYAMVSELSVKIVSKNWIGNDDDNEVYLSKPEYLALCNLNLFQSKGMVELIQIHEAANQASLNK